MLVEVRDLVAAHWFSLLTVAGALFFVRNYLYKGLNKHPGPVLASITDWWRFYLAYKRRPESEYRRLHDQHGDIIRIGPNQLSFSNPEAVKTIYALNNGFIKVRKLDSVVPVTYSNRVLTLFNRVISTPYTCQCRGANVSSQCSRRRTRSTTHSFDEMSLTPSR